MIRVLGGIREINPNGTVTIEAPLPPIDNVSDDVIVLYNDKRKASQKQRNLAFALIHEIAKMTGNTVGDENKTQKRLFVDKLYDDVSAKAIGRFSMADVDMTTAREYISYLIDLIVEYGIPTSFALAECADDINRYMYACAMQKVCAVCRKKADLHHVDRVGMGNDRTQISHLGMRFLPLCREHHQEAHRIGDDAMCDKYHLQYLTIDEKIADVYKLNKTKEIEKDE